MNRASNAILISCHAHLLNWSFTGAIPLQNSNQSPYTHVPIVPTPPHATPQFRLRFISQDLGLGCRHSFWAAHVPGRLPLVQTNPPAAAVAQTLVEWPQLLLKIVRGT